MNLLILKLGATGDVVRTTSVLRKFDARVTWITAAKNVALLENLSENIRCYSWEDRNKIPDTQWDLVINLEDTLDVAEFLKAQKTKQIFGAYADANNVLRYTDSARVWFDMSLISVYGREQADKMKLRNRRTYQDMIFEGLGFKFNGEKYWIAEPTETGLVGDVAIAPEAGPVWPMKNWSYYGELKSALEKEGLVVNVLPKRNTLLDHLCDVRNHRCLVGGDSLPMHLAMATDTQCVSLFTCTSPWEIYEYGLQTKIVSPLLEEFFYQRGRNERATSAIPLKEVFDATMARLKMAAPAKTAQAVAL